MILACRHLQKGRKRPQGKKTVLGATIPSCNPQESLSSSSCQVLLWHDGLRWQGTWCSGSCGPLPSYTSVLSSPASLVTGFIAEQLSAGRGAKGEGTGRHGKGRGFRSRVVLLSEVFRHSSSLSTGSSPLLHQQVAFGRTDAILEDHCSEANPQWR